jgi:hypothetical protein
MATSSTLTEAGLKEILDLVHALRSAYGEDALRGIAEALERGEEPELLRARITRELEGAAAEHAERLLERWSDVIDRGVLWAAGFGAKAVGDLAVVIVDPLCPLLPEAADAFPDGPSLHAREDLAELLGEVAPATARALRRPPSPGTQAVVAFTFGRVLACERDLPIIGDC